MSSKTFSNHLINYDRKTLAGKFAHNFRTYKMKHVDPVATTNNITSEGTRFNFSQKQINDYFDGIEQVYLKTKGRRLSSQTKLLTEHVLNVSKDTTKDQIIEYCKFLESKGFTVMNFVFHKDEGADVKNCDINYHVHVLTSKFSVLQVNGEWQVFNNKNDIKKAFLRELQDKGAEIFGMERGISKTITNRRHIPSSLYRNLQKFESVELEKALEVFDVKEIERILKEKIKEMKAQYTEVLKENKAGRPFYAKKEQIFKELEKDFKLVIKSLKKGIKAKKYEEVSQSINKLFKKVLDANDSFADLYQELLLSKNFDYEVLLEKLDDVEQRNLNLQLENKELKDKIKQQKPQHSPTQNTINAVTSINFEIEKPKWVVIGQRRAVKLFEFMAENKLTDFKYRKYMQDFLIDKDYKYVKQADLIDSFKAYVKKMEAPKVVINSLDFGL